MINTKIRHVNYAESLDGYMWAINPLTMDKLQLCCLTETSVEIIKPPSKLSILAMAVKDTAPICTSQPSLN